MKDEQLIKDLVALLKTDSRASSYQKEYADRHLAKYLEECIDKDDSLLYGIIIALEKHLEL